MQMRLSIPLQAGLSNVTEENSKDSCGLRMADMMAGTIYILAPHSHCYCDEHKPHELLRHDIPNDIFAENAWYFRNALVRANYTNLQKGIHETTEYLEAFLRNLLLGEKNELHNRNLHISELLNEEKVDIWVTKVDIENGKVDIQDKKVDIESVLSEKGGDFSVKTTIHIHRLFEKFGFDEVFGRSAVMELLGLKGSGASKLLSNLVQADIIEPVSGHGKGKYKFKK